VRLALPLVPPLSDDLPVSHEDGADDRIWLSRPPTTLGELERSFQERHASASRRPR
jgi:hypothetical protein